MTNKVVLSLKVTRAIWYFYVLFCFVFVFVFFFFYIRSFLYWPVFTFRLKWSIFVSMAGIFSGMKHGGICTGLLAGTVRNWLPWIEHDIKETTNYNSVRGKVKDLKKKLKKQVLYIYIYIVMETEHAIKETTNYNSVRGKVKD